MRNATPMSRASRRSINGLLVTLAMLGSASVPLAANARVLIEDSGFRALIPEEVQCGAPLELGVATRDPALLDADTADMQRIVDASLAAIRFQCPDIPEVTVQGSLQDRSDADFVAVANAASGWRLQPRKTFRLDTPSGGTGGMRDDVSRGFSPVVAGLEPGMRLETARDALASTFDAEPRLIDGERVVVEKNGCRVGIDWRNPPSDTRPGWRCLQAWFTRGDDPRLYRVDYAEVVDGNRLEEATDMLVGRYGEPVTREGRTWWQDQPRTVHLGWGDEVVIKGEPRHKLRAAVRPSGSMTMLEISLYEPAVTRTAGQKKFRF